MPSLMPSCELTGLEEILLGETEHEDKETLDFDDFKTLMASYMTRIDKVTLDFKG